MIDTSRWRWPVAESAAFRFTRAPNGELSHFHPGFGFRIGPIEVGTSEALYHTFKFPRHPDVQLAILRAPSPREAKRIGRMHGELLRADWDDVRVEVMHAVVAWKTLAHRARIEAVLRATVGRWIVEESTRDAFWGARRTGDVFDGANVLGRIWMRVRDELLPIGPDGVWRPVIGPVDELTVLGHDFHALIADPVVLAAAA